MVNDSFWEFSHCSKIDCLKERRHYQVIKQALVDPITQLEPDGGDWIAYGNEEALLIQPSSCYLRIILMWYYQLSQMFAN